MRKSINPLNPASSLVIDMADHPDGIYHYTLVPSRRVRPLGAMGKVRRGGSIIKWFIGDHPPRHVHVEKETGKLLGRFNLETMAGMEGWQAERKLVRIIEDLIREGRLRSC